MEPVSQLQAILSQLPREAQARKLTAQQLRDLAADLGLSASSCRTKGDLLGVLTLPLEALRSLDGVQFEWEVSTDRVADAFIRWRGSCYLVRIDDDDLFVEPGNPDHADDLLVSSLQRHQGDIIEVAAQGVGLPRFLDLLESHLLDPYLEIEDRNHGILQAWQLDDGTIAWFPEDAWWDSPVLLRSHWDFVGPGEPSPVSDNPGTVLGTRYRDYLLCTDPAAEMKHVGRLAGDNLDAGTLLDALGRFHEHFVNSSTYSLDVKTDLDADEVRRLLSPARGVGGLWVNGRWWYETPNDWSEARLEHLPAPKIEPGEVLQVHLEWLYPACGGSVDLYLFDESDPSLRMALTTLAAHKANGSEREAVGWASVEWPDGAALSGVAARSSRRLRVVAGVAPMLHVDVVTGEVSLGSGGGATSEPGLEFVEADGPPSDAFLEAIYWLRARSGPYPPLPRRPDQPQLKPPVSAVEALHEAASMPRPVLPRIAAPRVADLEPGSQAFVFPRAVAQDEEGRFWIDPTELARPTGLPSSDPRIWVDPDGTFCISTRDIVGPVGRTEPRHRIPASNRDS